MIFRSVPVILLLAVTGPGVHGACDATAAETCLTPLIESSDLGGLDSLTPAELQELCTTASNALACAEPQLSDCSSPNQDSTIQAVLDLRDSIQAGLSTTCASVTALAGCDAAAVDTCMSSVSQYGDVQQDTLTSDQRQELCKEAREALSCAEPHLSGCSSSSTDTAVLQVLEFRDDIQETVNQFCSAGVQLTVSTAVAALAFLLHALLRPFH